MSKFAQEDYEFFERTETITYSDQLQVYSQYWSDDGAPMHYNLIRNDEGSWNLSFEGGHLETFENPEAASAWLAAHESGLAEAHDE